MDLLQLQTDPAAFRAALMIDTDAGPQPLAEIADPWQRQDWEMLDDGWKRAVLGRSHRAKYSRGFLERPRGHDKSGGLGIMAAWALFASRRPISGIGAAADTDQARLLRDAIGKLVYVNPWLGQLLEVQNYRVVNRVTKSTLDIISSDAPTSYGLTPDFVLVDEFTHHKKRDLWDSLLSSSAKRSTCMLVVITNAGIQDDWQWQTREAIRQDPTWYFHRLDGPTASWITPELLAEQERLLPSIAYRRLWLNEWTSGGGDLLTPDDLAAAFKKNLKPLPQKQSGWAFVAGVDLGVSRDASAICILGVRRCNTWDRDQSEHGRIRLAYTKRWKPTKGNKVHLPTVQAELTTLHRAYEFKTVNFDPWQAVAISQALSLKGLPMNEVTFTARNLQNMATAVLEVFNDRKIDLYPEEHLERDLRRARVEERPNTAGFRITFPRDSTGHGDTGTAFVLALLAATELSSTIYREVQVATEGNSLGDFAERKAAYESEMAYLESGGFNDTTERLRQLLGGHRNPRLNGDWLY